MILICLQRISAHIYTFDAHKSFFFTEGHVSTAISVSPKQELLFRTHSTHLCLSGTAFCTCHNILVKGVLFIRDRLCCAQTSYILWNVTYSGCKSIISFINLLISITQTLKYLPVTKNWIFKHMCKISCLNSLHKYKVQNIHAVLSHFAYNTN